jgi:phage tail-like protein
MPAPLFPAKAHHHNPYRTFKFQVLIDGQTVAGLKKMSALKKTTEALDWRIGGEPALVRKLPVGTKYEAITLEQGLTHDLVFEQWANMVNNFDLERTMSPKNFRKDLVINVMDLQGQVAISYQVKRAWVSEYQALPDLDDVTNNTVGIQTIKLEHEGWQCDVGVAESTKA